MSPKAVDKASKRFRELVEQQAGKDSDAPPEVKEALMLGLDLALGVARNLAVLAERGRT